MGKDRAKGRSRTSQPCAKRGVSLSKWAKVILPLRSILPVDDISNAAWEAVANNIKGTLALPHAYGRLQFGEDLELFFRTLIGIGANPNVAAAI